MRLYMDDPDRFAPLGAAAPHAAAPDPRDRALWAALAGAPPRLPAVTPARPDPFWQVGCLVAEAAGSQYDALRDLAARGALPAGHLFSLAGRGRGFHGQHGRSWRVLDGNLHLCAVLEADLPVPGWGPALPALPALAALDAVRRHAPAGRAGIKWVNDVLLEGAKVGGVLTAVRARAGRLERVFLGIGLNVAAAPDLGEDPCLPAAGCLAPAAGPALDLGTVAVTLLDALRRRWEALLACGPAALVEAYRGDCLVIGRRVAVAADGSGAGDRAGTVTAVGDDLALHLDDGGAPLTRGRITLLDA